ncbi:hypothetical protein SAMN02745130_03364 [Thiothrix eikelboomii]|uniref:Uncharacterized protein n=1 Tax=Thiothrix eikelboomii TaxID=92487 RepID=A0A1T4XTJ3_9GAMM|nr:hypothetical protein SAMN02745130_03364 [Thiothrix eikelboomii]
MSGYFDIFCAIIATGFVALEVLSVDLLRFAKEVGLISVWKSDILWRFLAFANIAMQ